MEELSLSQQLIPFLQVLVALVLGSLVGIERTFAGKTAGMRTYGLVAMGSCLLIVTSEVVNSSFIGVTNFDPMRLAASVIMGVGFIGAGLIILKEERKLEGLTTAAGLWVACGIGITIGFGLWSLAIFATFLTLFVLSTLWYVERHFKKKFTNGDSRSLHHDNDT
jgi:putative Mg2+ transporter-C (MgtC) family protein